MADSILPQGQSDAVANVPAADPNGTGSVTDEVITVKELAKTITGTEYPDDETALNSLKELRSWGTQNAQKVKTLEQQLQQQANPDLQKQVADLSAQVKDTLFYQQHPELNNPQMKAVIQKMGGASEELLQDEVFKSTSAAITQSLEMDKSKSILHSNPRLGMVQDSLTKSQEAIKNAKQSFMQGDVTSANQQLNTAASEAMTSVLDAYPDLVSK